MKVNSDSCTGATERIKGMTVKLKISYERPEELQRILNKLRKDIKSIKAPRQQSGKFRRAYVEIKDGCDVATDMLE